MADICALCDRPLGEKSHGCPANHKVSFEIEMKFGSATARDVSTETVIRVPLLKFHKMNIHIDNEPTPPGTRWKGGNDDPT